MTGANCVVVTPQRQRADCSSITRIMGSQVLILAFNDHPLASRQFQYTLPPVFKPGLFSQFRSHSKRGLNMFNNLQIFELAVLE